MIDKLTPEQEALIPVIRDKWLRKFFSLEFDEQKSREFIEYLYKLSGLDKPLVIFLDSPFGIQLGTNYVGYFVKNDNLKKQVRAQVSDQVRAQVSDQVSDQVNAQVYDQVHAQVHDQVSDQVNAQVYDQVHAQVHDQVHAQVNDQVSDQVRAQVSDQVRAQVSDQVSDQVNAQVYDQVHAQVNAQVRDQVHDQVRDQVNTKFFDWGYYGDISDFGWISFYDFFLNIFDLDNKFLEYKDKIQPLFNIIQLKGFCLVSKPPIFIKRDESNRLHCIEDYAIYFADGYGQHYVYGVFFSDELFNKFFKNDFKSEDILSLGNTEQKAALIKVFGYEKIISGLKNVKVLDRVKDKSYVDNKPIIYEVLEFELNSNLICRVVKVECHSEHKITCIGVPREKQTETCNCGNYLNTDTCFFAIGWTFKLCDKCYKKRMIMET